MSLNDTHGRTKDDYLQAMRRLTERQLCCRLRDARRKLLHHGKHSYTGREAIKEIDAAKFEFQLRGLEIPADGAETARWDKAKGATP